MRMAYRQLKDYCEAKKKRKQEVYKTIKIKLNQEQFVEFLNKS